LRKYGRCDDNHSDIVKALRQAGCSVVSLAAVGDGVPDILVGREGGKNYLLEIKDGTKPPSGKKLTQQQRYFFSIWKGHAAVVNDVYEALEAVGI
jgi:Holliday junction resolvase